MQEHPLVERYISVFEAALAALDVPEGKEIAVEIRSHIAEALAEGKPLDTVLEALGPADGLARAYAVELTLNPRGAQRFETIGRVSRVVGLVAVGSVMTMIVAGALGSVGFGFTLSGLAIVLLAGFEAAGVHLPGVEMQGIPPSAVIALGVSTFVIGAGALYLLWKYMRFLVRASRRLLPGQAASR
jgi:uncharacterized membrane protein